MRRDYSADKLEALRRRARRFTLGVHPDSDGWTKSLIDPMKILAIFQPLRVSDGSILRAYQYASGEDGNGAVYAMPQDATFPDPSACAYVQNSFLYPPMPADADNKFMKYIHGPDSPRSYLLASLLARELLELGARRHGCSWSRESILGTAPELHRWIPVYPDMGVWGPSVEWTDDEVIVSFRTRSTGANEQILMYRDRYKRGSYSFTTDGFVLADAFGLHW